jgi:SPP1 gp7 family putative phage head morphogenesis protein
VQFWPLVPTWIDSLPSAGHPYYTVTLEGGHQVHINEEFVVYMRNPNPASPYGRGSGAGRALADEIATDEFAAQFTKNVFFNKGQPSMVIGVEGAKQDALKEAKRRFDQEQRGLGMPGRGQRPFWHGGKLTVQELQKSIVDLQVVDLRRSERDTFQQVFGVPPEKLGIVENSNRATSEAADVTMAKNVLIPILEDERLQIQRDIVPFYDENIFIEYEDPSPQSESEQREWAKVSPWAFDANEIRVRAGELPKDSMAGLHMVPAMMVERTYAGPTVAVESRAAKQLGAATKAVNAFDIPQIVAACVPDHFSLELTPIMRAELEAWGAAALVDLGIDAAFDMTNPAVIEHLSNFATERMADITTTTKVQLQAELAAGVADGESIRALSARVAGVFREGRSYRSERIARSEVGRSANFGTYDAQVQSGVVREREWVATRDDRVRDSHAALDGVRVRIDEPFVLAGAETMYPGNTGVAAQDINERCTTIAVIEDAPTLDADALDAVWKAFDRALVPWERQIEQASNRAFAKQEDDVQAALEAAAAE